MVHAAVNAELTASCTRTVRHERLFLCDHKKHVSMFVHPHAGCKLPYKLQGIRCAGLQEMPGQYCHLLVRMTDSNVVQGRALTAAPGIVCSKSAAHRSLKALPNWPWQLQLQLPTWPMLSLMSTFSSQPLCMGHCLSLPQPLLLRAEQEPASASDRSEDLRPTRDGCINSAACI